MSKKPKDPTLNEVIQKDLEQKKVLNSPYFQSAKELADSRKCFHKCYMEYVSKLNDIEAKKKVDYMENVNMIKLY